MSNWNVSAPTLGIALCALFTLGWAQAPAAPQVQGSAPQPATTQMVLKGKAPVSTELLKVKLPKPAEAVLENGLRLMVLEDRRLPQVTFQIIIPGAGGYFDPEDKVGLASYTAQLMREGTKTRTSPQISEALETISLPAATAPSRTSSWQCRHSSSPPPTCAT